MSKVQFALCEASKYFFYLKYESGVVYKPSSREFDLLLQQVSETDATRLKAIWCYWEQDDAPDEVNQEDELHPDHRVE